MAVVIGRSSVFGLSGSSVLSCWISRDSDQQFMLRMAHDLGKHGLHASLHYYNSY
jgi:hypothetical protein